VLRAEHQAYQEGSDMRTKAVVAALGLGALVALGAPQRAEAGGFHLSIGIPFPLPVPVFPAPPVVVAPPPVVAYPGYYAAPYPYYAGPVVNFGYRSYGGYGGYYGGHKHYKDCGHGYGRGYGRGHYKHGHYR
jgi:hypothetical protein